MMKWNASPKQLQAWPWMHNRVNVNQENGRSDYLADMRETKPGGAFGPHPTRAPGGRSLGAEEPEVSV